MPRRRKRKRKPPPAPTKPGLYVEEILRWADAWKARMGRWPEKSSGLIPESPDEKWSTIDGALSKRNRGLRPGSTLLQLLAEFRGVRNRMRLPPFEIPKILAWADAHYRRTGDWPVKGSGPIADAPGETWMAVDMALNHSSRGMSGRSSLARLLAQERGRRSLSSLPDLSVELILSWADAHFDRTGSWPRFLSGPIPQMPGEKWWGIEAALRKGLRGFPGGSSLYQLLVAHGRIKPLKPQGLQRRRIQAGLSRPGLAAKVGVSYGTVVMWEQGRRLPQPDKLAKLAAVLNLSVEKLREEMRAVGEGRRKAKGIDAQ